jgi:hypothetical protein
MSRHADHTAKVTAAGGVAHADGAPEGMSFPGSVPCGTATAGGGGR